MTMMATSRHAHGLILGLAAGDRNGGPQRIAMRLAEALLDCQATGVPFRQGDAILRYVSWSAPELALMPHEPDTAYDTGAAYQRVIRRLIGELKSSKDVLSSLQHRGRADDEGTLERGAALEWLEQRCAALALDDLRQHNSGGIGAAHRAAVLAFVPPPFRVDVVAAADACSTQPHPDAQGAAIAVACICHSLLEQASTEEGCGGGTPLAVISRLRLCKAVSTARAKTAAVSESITALLDAAASSIAHRIHEDARACSAFAETIGIDRKHRSEVRAHALFTDGGYAPEAMAAALVFVEEGNSFDEALRASLDFAGPANFCPVLVGAIAGALWGSDVDPDATAGVSSCVFQGKVGVEASHLRHREALRGSGAHLRRLFQVGDRLSELWQSHLAVPQIVSP